MAWFTVKVHHKRIEGPSLAGAHQAAAVQVSDAINERIRLMLFLHALAASLPRPFQPETS
jgi:hypothetical protein